MPEVEVLMYVEDVADRIGLDTSNAHTPQPTPRQ